MDAVELRDERQVLGTLPNLGNVFECPMVKVEYVFRLIFSLYQQRLFNYYLLLLYSLIDPPDVTTAEGYGIGSRGRISCSIADDTC